jgi:DNA-directed RNA polymerase subunit RPC12/RpoP
MSKKDTGGLHVQRTTEQIVLVCEDCGEELVLFGSEENWRSRRAIFVCECGHKITLDGRADEGVLAAS